MAKRAPAASAEPAEEAESNPTLLLNLTGIGLATFERPFVVEYFPTPAQAAAEREVRAEELGRQRRKAERVLKSIKKEWDKKLRRSGNVATFNVSYRTKFRRLIAPLQYVIQIDVARKYPESVLEQKNIFRFERIWDGVPIKVREARATSCMAAGAPSATESVIRGGVAIGSTEFPLKFGTLGICIPLAATGALVGTTNAHVAGVTTDGTTNIVQPPSSQTATIGHLLKPVFYNFADAASISDESAPRTFQEGVKGLPIDGNEYPGSSYRFLRLTNLSTMRSLEHKPVSKFGASTNGSKGSIVNACMDSPSVSNIPENNFDGIFRNVIAVGSLDTSFVGGGDSGAALVIEVKEGGNVFPVVLGLMFAGLDDGTESYAIPLGRVLRDLGLFDKVDPARLWPAL